ncbi:MAG: hypothetical protein MHM6MM_001083 [Cercozoa sp. M6MM]
MRRFESFLTYAALWQLSGVKPDYSSASALAVLVTHLLVEFPRLQCVPLYLVCLFMCTSSGQESGLWLRVLLAAIMLSGTAAMCLMPVPTKHLYLQSDSYTVGTKEVTVELKESHYLSLTSLQLGDDDSDLAKEEQEALLLGPKRDAEDTEFHADLQTGHINCRLFYPTESTGRHAPYFRLGRKTAHGIAHGTQMPAAMFWQVSLASSGAVHDATCLFHNSAHEEDECDYDIQGMPVIVLSHGLKGTADVALSLARYYSSRGYLVVCVEHGDGTASLAQTETGRLQYYLHPKPDMEFTTRMKWRRRQLRRRVAEIRAVLEALQEWHEDGMCRIDFDRISLLGHSFGAATVLTAAALEKPGRLHAVLAHDPWMEPIGPRGTF